MLSPPRRLTIESHAHQKRAGENLSPYARSTRPSRSAGRSDLGLLLRGTQRRPIGVNALRGVERPVNGPALGRVAERPNHRQADVSRRSRSAAVVAHIVRCRSRVGVSSKRRQLHWGSQGVCLHRLNGPLLYPAPPLGVQRSGNIFCVPYYSFSFLHEKPKKLTDSETKWNVL